MPFGHTQLKLIKLDRKTQNNSFKNDRKIGFQTTTLENKISDFSLPPLAMIVLNTFVEIRVLCYFAQNNISFQKTNNNITFKLIALNTRVKQWENRQALTEKRECVCVCVCVCVCMCLKAREIQFFENNFSRHRLINFEFIKDEIGVSKTFQDYFSQMEVLLATNLKKLNENWKKYSFFKAFFA